jgi:hypothetical protein
MIFEKFHHSYPEGMYILDCSTILDGILPISTNRRNNEASEFRVAIFLDDPVATAEYSKHVDTLEKVCNDADSTF